jgi:hypothetical protein
VIVSLSNEGEQGHVFCIWLGGEKFSALIGTIKDKDLLLPIEGNDTGDGIAFRKRRALLGGRKGKGRVGEQLAERGNVTWCFPGRIWSISSTCAERRA